MHLTAAIYVSPKQKFMAAVEFNSFALISFLLILVMSVWWHWDLIENKKRDINHLSHALLRGGAIILVVLVDAQNYLHGVGLFIFWAALFWIGFDAILNLARGKNLFYPGKREVLERAGHFDIVFAERPILYLAIKIGSLVFGWLACALFDNVGEFQPVLLSGLGWMFLSGILSVLLITILLDGKIAKWYRERWTYTVPASGIIIFFNAYLAIRSRPTEIPEPEWLDIYTLPAIVGVGFWAFLIINSVRKR